MLLTKINHGNGPIFLAGDQLTVAAVERAFAQAGADPSTFNTDIIPDVTAIGLPPMGIGLNHTQFTTLVCLAQYAPLHVQCSSFLTLLPQMSYEVMFVQMRVAVCSNSSVCDEYYARNWTLLHVTPRIPHVQQSFGLYMRQIASSYNIVL